MSLLSFKSPDIMLSPFVYLREKLSEANSLCLEIYEDICDVEIANSMDEAVDCAVKYARPNSTVLFSPACTSFDWYESYSDRGLDFIRAVNEQSLGS